MTKVKQNHPEVITHSYKGFICRFRYVDGDVYIPICDAQNILMCRYNFKDVYRNCGSATRIEFYANGDGLMSIQGFDLHNLCKGYVSKSVTDAQKVKIEWMKNIIASIKNNHTEPEHSTSDVTIFSHSLFGDIRTAGSSEQPLFCLADICRALDLGNPSQVKTRLMPKGIQTIDLLTLNNNEGLKTNRFGNTSANFINEGNLYKCIFASRKPEAVAFQDWICDEVLPTIRKHGIYATPETTERILNDPDFGIKLLQQIKDEREAKLLAQAEREKALQQLACQNQVVKRMQPKEDYYDEVVESREHYSTTHIAAELGISYTTMRKLLYNAGLILQPTGTMQPKDPSLMEEVKIGSRKVPAMQWTKIGRDVIFDTIAPNQPK